MAQTKDSPTRAGPAPERPSPERPSPERPSPERPSPEGSAPEGPAPEGDRRLPLDLVDGQPDDGQLIAASCLDPDRFAELYDRHAAAMYRFAARRLGPEGAEDVVADAVLAAFRGRNRFDPERTDARPWLLGILTREIAGRRRAERARYRALARTLPEIPDAGPAERVADAVTAGALAGPLAAALARLADRDRDVLLLVAWADFTYLEVADALMIPVGTVRSRLHRARRTVRAALGDLTDRFDAEEA